MAKQLIIGNWKMNPGTAKEGLGLFKKLKSVVAKSDAEVGIAPPALYLEAFKKAKPGKIKLVAQDAFPGDTGAETGAISVGMIAALGTSYVIVGHSEMRARGESDENIAGKIKSALEYGITPVLCVGEKEREQDMWYLHTVKSQLETALATVSKKRIEQVVIAYEPVWAIGKQALREATPKECEEMVIYIRKVLADRFGQKETKRVRILYGGSVDAKNAKVFLEQGGVNGLLIGRASLDAKQFATIVS